MTSIPLTREVRISIDWSQLSMKLAEVIANGFIAAFGADGVSGGISALVGAASTLRLDSDPGEKAYSLAVLCFAWSLDELVSEGGVDRVELANALRLALDEAKELVDAGQMTCPASFLERPTTLPLYKILRNQIVNRKAKFRGSVIESDDILNARFDSAFTRSMFEVMSRRPEYYKSLRDVFSLPGMSANDLELNWRAYRQRLVHDFEVKPIFGQEVSKVSLSQLYIPLRGYWPREGESEEAIVDDRLSLNHDVAMLDDLLAEWVNSTDVDDYVRLIGGGPGSGKSTTLKCFACKLARREDIRPLFVPLQHIDLDGNLREAINSHFTARTSGSFAQAPLSRSAVEDGPPLLLIFDGLDELARPGEAAKDVVNLFVAKLIQLVSALRGDSGKQMKVVVSGRMPSFQAAKRFISAPSTACLEVYGFTPQGSSGPDTELWKLDQRPLWWIQYSRLKGLPEHIPPAFESSQLEGITHEPLLCYLLVLSGFATNNWEEAAENPNRIYEALVNSVWERGWGEGHAKRQGPGRSLSKLHFNQLMQTIALAAWQGGDTRVASENAFLAAIKTTGAQAAWETFQGDNGSDVTNLAMNFYLKASEAKQRGFEFTHKSFGDYLAAKAILDFSEQLPVWIHRNVDHAMSDWVAATCTGTLTTEILIFLRDEVRLRLTREGSYIPTVIDAKRAFELFASTVLAEGLPVQGNSTSWRAAEKRQRNAETMAWAVLNSFSLGLASQNREERYVSVNWPDASSFSALLRRISGVRSSESPALKCFSYLIAPNADLFGLSLFGIDLRGAKMDGANFSGCHLISGNFEDGTFVGGLFERAMLDRANFRGSILREARLVDARLEGTFFHGADLTESVVSAGTFIYADLDVFNQQLLSLRYYEWYGTDKDREFNRSRIQKLLSLVAQIKRTNSHSQAVKS